MMLPKGTQIAVADGEKLNLFRNAGDEARLSLEAQPHHSVDGSKGSTDGHQSSSGNPDQGQSVEDGFSAGVVNYLNQEALGGRIEKLVIIASPRALGEMRKHYHKALSATLLLELPKDLTGHSLADIEKAISAA